MTDPAREEVCDMPRVLPSPVECLAPRPGASSPLECSADVRRTCGIPEAFSARPTDLRFGRQARHDRRGRRVECRIDGMNHPRGSRDAQLRIPPTGPEEPSGGTAGGAEWGPVTSASSRRETVALDAVQAISQLQDRSSAKRRSAAKRLRKLGDPSAGPALLDALRSEVRDTRTWETQYQVTMALGTCGSPSDLSYLRYLVLQRETGQRVHDFLTSCVSGPRSDVVEAATSSLAWNYGTCRPLQPAPRPWFFMRTISIRA
ncbi:HEAT repeat domain-containing protein [Streptomyces sp. NPDC006632]|uniref:HEAT repeat domain-containing protein n=1 Tax=Streptomyces sp. NPDC006632 TaxID=3157182 RepID=UPI0033B0908A